MKIHIRGGRLIDPVHQRDTVTDLYIAAGRIVAFGQAPLGFVANRTIDADGYIVCPGLIDLAVRLREPGLEYKATLESEMKAALAGGVTSLVCQPDTDPPLDEPGLVEMLKHKARVLNHAHLYPLGAMTQGLKGDTITEMAQLAQAGCVGFSQAHAPVIDTQVLLRAMHYAKTFDFTLWLHAQEPFLARDGVAAAGPLATRLGLSGIPVEAEVIALQTLLTLQRASGVRLHICRLSSAQGIALIRQAKQEGHQVSCDVAAHQVHLTDMDIAYFDAQCRLTPPLRLQRDRDAIRHGLLDGTIDAICSDHTPVDDDAKLLPFAEAEPGATGLELLLSLTLKWAEQTQQPLAHAVARLTQSPAQVLGKPEIGQLAVGAIADICIFDPNASWEVKAENLRSQGKNTPFLGMTLPGQVKATLIAGHIAFEQTLA